LLRVIVAALAVMAGAATISFAAGPAPVTQGQNPIPIPGPAPGTGGQTLELQPRQQKGAVLNEVLSQRANAYLHRHRLPYVDAQVFADANGKLDSVVLTGSVRTAFGKQDAEDKVRQALGSSAFAINNQVQVGSENSPGRQSLTIGRQGCGNTIFGSTCQPSDVNGRAHAFLYSLTPISNPQGFGGQSGTVNLIQASNRIRQLEFYPTEINVPDQDWSRGFPGYPNINQWFGVCYDGGFNVPVAQEYTIVTVADDGVAVWIDDRLVTDNEDFLGNHVVGVGHQDIQTPPYFSGGDGGELGVASRPIHLSAGLHGVIVKYWQGWPSYLGVQVWAIPSSHFRRSGGFPPNSYLMQLVGPPGGVLKCPH